MTDHASLSVKSNPSSIVVTSRQLHIPVFFSSSCKLLINLLSGCLLLISTCKTLVKFDLINSFYHLTEVRSLVSHVLVYDVMRRETLTNLSDLWAKEVELYSTNQDCVKMLVGNKLDRESDRVVTKEEAVALAGELGCLFTECSAKTRENVEKCFEQLALKIMEVPSLIKEKDKPMPEPKGPTPGSNAPNQGCCC